MLKNLLFTISLFFTSLIACNNKTIEPDTILSKKLDDYLQALTQLNRFSGAVVVAKGNKVLLNKGYGFASHEFDIPNTSCTKFKICSITKMITATAIMMLQEKKLLHVNDPISKYISDFPRGGDITIHQLLSHTSGIASCNASLEMVVLPTTLEQLLAFFKSKELEYEPGTDYQYSNAGYSILSFIIEKVSGKKYESFIQENILTPLCMHESFFRNYNYEILKNCAVGYCMNEQNRFVNGHYIYENSNGGGGLISTAHDLYIFANNLKNGQLINNTSLHQMFTPYHTKENYGYGCQINYINSKKVVEHGGMLSSGFKSNLSLFIDDDIYIIILSNAFFSWVNEARNTLTAIMFDLPYELPSSNTIKVNASNYDDYAGRYDHPSNIDYKIARKENTLYLPDNNELSPIAPDQFIVLTQSNIVYTFIRNNVGKVTQLNIKGGGPYFEIKCAKKN